MLGPDVPRETSGPFHGAASARHLTYWGGARYVKSDGTIPSAPLYIERRRWPDHAASLNHRICIAAVPTQQFIEECVDIHITVRALDELE